MLRKVTVVLMVILAFVLQGSVLSRIPLGGIVPNLLIIITSSVGFMRGKTEGLAVGFLSGLILDVFFGNILGFYALTYMVIGYLNGFFLSIFYREDIKLPIILITASELAYCFICYVFLFLLRSKMNLGYYTIHIFLPEIAYTILATLVLYKPIQWLNDFLERREKGRA